ncbi:FecR family protein [Methylorubrum populi]
MPDPTSAPRDGASRPQAETDDPRMNAALEWFVRMQDEGASPDERRRFEGWLAADPANAAALIRAKALWDRFDVVADQAEGRRGARIDRRKVLFGGMTVGLAAGGGAWLASRPDLFADYRTGIGGRRTVPLPNGVRAELGADSAMSLDGAPDGGRVVLYRGEGFFEVPPGQPFKVSAGLVVAGPDLARASGTRFDVKRLDDMVIVTAEAQAVAVDARSDAPLSVAQGWQARCAPALPPVLAQADLAAVTAWRRDRIVFRDAPLPQVAAELERYGRGRILLLGSGLGGLSVTAAFDAHRADKALDVLSETLPIRVSRLTPLLTIVRAA